MNFGNIIKKNIHCFRNIAEESVTKDIRRTGGGRLFEVIDDRSLLKGKSKLRADGFVSMAKTNKLIQDKMAG